MAWEKQFQRRIEGLLERADVEINGGRPWDLQVKQPQWFRRVALGGSLALGESYMDGWWDCQALDQFFHRLLRAGADKGAEGFIRKAVARVAAGLFNLQSASRADQVARHHYDLDNGLFQIMLDQGMNYSCAYWDHAQDLNQAQENKLSLICDKLRLAPGMRLLDIGCGWGGLAAYAARRHGVKVDGITVSRAQAELASELCRGLPVKVLLRDYRDLGGKYDRLVSVGMFEHVGYKNYRTFMKKAADCLADDGLFLLHTIGGNESTIACDPWITTYIFPNGMLPSPKQITRAWEGLFVLEDWHSFGEHYDRTLLAWHDNFVSAWSHLQGRYDLRFYRMWTYYLLSCAGAFRARAIQLWQLVFSKSGLVGGYRSARLAPAVPTAAGSPI